MVVARSWLAVKGHRKYITVIVEVLNIGIECAEKVVFHVDGDRSSTRRGGVGSEDHAIVVDGETAAGCKVIERERIASALGKRGLGASTTST